MTARDRNDDEADAPTLRLDTIDPSVADAPDDVSLGALLGIQRRTQRQPSRLGRILRTSIVMVLWLGTAAGATTAAWTVHDLLHDDHVTDGALLPNLDLRPAGTPTAAVVPILPNITIASGSSTSGEGTSSTSVTSDVELRAGTTAEDGTSGGGDPVAGGRTPTTTATGGSPSAGPTAGPTTRGSAAPTITDEGGPDTTTRSSSGPGPGTGTGGPATTPGGSGNPNPPEPGTTATTANNNGPGGGGGGSPGGPPPTTTPPTPTVGPLVTISGTGGSADVRCTGNAIALLASRPLSGYNPDVQESGPAKARVRFISATATYKIEAHCAGGSLVRDIVQ